MNDNDNRFAGDARDHDETDQPFDAIITGVTVSGGKRWYRWDELIPDSLGDLGTMVMGRQGTYNPTGPTGVNRTQELNDQTVTVGAKVRIRLRAVVEGDLFYDFVAPSSLGATVQEADGSPAYANVTTFQFDQADGFVVTQPGAGIARVDQTPASTTTVGHVTIGAQILGGVKRFNDGFTFGQVSATPNGSAVSYLAAAFYGDCPDTIVSRTAIPANADGWNSGAMNFAVPYGTPSFGSIFARQRADTGSVGTFGDDLWIVPPTTGALYAMAEGRIILAGQIGVFVPGTPTADDGTIIFGKTGNLAPGATFVRGVCVNLGSGSFAAGSVTGGSGGTTGLTLTGTTTLTLGGTLVIANGGTGATTASGARTNLGLGTAAVENVGFFLQAVNDLADVISAANARINLGLAIGTDVQAQSAVLSALAGVSTRYTGTQLIGGLTFTYNEGLLESVV